MVVGPNAVQQAMNRASIRETRYLPGNDGDGDALPRIA